MTGASRDGSHGEGLVELLARLDPQLGERLDQVVLHRAGGDEQPLGDLGVGEPGGGKLRDPLLDRAEQSALDADLRDAAAAALSGATLRRRDGTPFPDEVLQRVDASYLRPPDDEATARKREMLELRLSLIEAMRARLNDLGRDGSYSTPALRHALAELDADQLSLELRLDDED